MRPFRKWLIIFVVLILLAGGTTVYARPVPVIQPHQLPITPLTLTPTALAWPKQGQAAIGAMGYGVLGESGAQASLPMASITKIFTALAVLQVKPLKTGQDGPTLTLNQADADSYNKFVALGGSVVPVAVGETLTEYQALQALLLPSANNMADSLVRWAFGTTAAYLDYAPKLLASLNLTHTHIADTSGFSPRTISTPHDLVLLGIKALEQPAIRRIVQQKAANIPVAGQIENTNRLLGINGINGIKTGNTEQAGGCLLFSADQLYPNGKRLTLVGAVMGLPSLGAVFPAAAKLLHSAIPGFKDVAIVRQNMVVGRYTTPWGQSSDVIVSADLRALVWSAQKIDFKIHLDQLKLPANKSSMVGSLTVDTAGTHKSLPLNLQTSLEPPGLTWRLTHLFKNY